MIQLTKERLIDKLRDELYKKHGWTGDTAVKFIVPIILAIRHNDTGQGDDIISALEDLREGGKGELDNTLNQLMNGYRDISILLRETLRDMIHFVGRQPDGIILDILDFIGRKDNRPLLLALRDEDFIGSMFERSVSDAFRGDDGRFFTPRNIILIVREMMRLLLQTEEPNRKISEYTVCDPCCGSARFLIYWSELIKNEISDEAHPVNHRELNNRLRAKAENSLFGADIHSDTAAYGCLNMLLHGDGATNITTNDSLNQFGFFADVPLLRQFAKEFQDKWTQYNVLARQSSDLISTLDSIEAKKNVLENLLSEDSIDLSNEKWLDVVRLIRALIEVDRKYPTRWETIHAIHRRHGHHAVFETMVDDWGRRNPKVTEGFDVLITNPPFGRQADLMVNDPHILCQYRLATQWWVPDMPKSRVEELLVRTIAAGYGLVGFYIQLLNKHLGKKYVAIEDEVRFDRLDSDILAEMIISHDVAIEDHFSDPIIKLRECIHRAIKEKLKADRSELDRTAVGYKERDMELRKAAQAEHNRINTLSLEELKEEIWEFGLNWSDVFYRKELVDILSKSLKRIFIDEIDEILFEQLPASEALRVCASYLYEENGKPGEVLSKEIISYFGKEWLTVEDIEGPDGYASKVTLVFNGQPYTIYYDNDGFPIVYKRKLPKQVLFIEQFLRMLKQNGKVFMVLDTGILSNLDDEYIRRFIFHNARWRATVEFPHGAFKAAKANVKTAIVLLEKRPESSELVDYEIFGSLPRYLGYDLKKQDTPLIFENDLGRVVCDYQLFLTGQRLCSNDCPWDEKRFCKFGDQIEMDRSPDEAFSRIIENLDDDDNAILEGESIE